MANVQRMTLEESLALPEGPPYVEYEIGELILVASPTPEHQDIVSELSHVLRQKDHLHLLSPTDRKIHGSPDLVVEVTPRTPARDRVHKFRVSYGNGVPWYSIVDSITLAIEEYHATPQGYLRAASVVAGEEFRPQLFPGLIINLAALLGLESPASPPA